MRQNPTKTAHRHHSAGIIRRVISAVVWMIGTGMDGIVYRRTGLSLVLWIYGKFSGKWSRGERIETINNAHLHIDWPRYRLSQDSQATSPHKHLEGTHVLFHFDDTNIALSLRTALQTYILMCNLQLSPAKTHALIPSFSQRNKDKLKLLDFFASTSIIKLYSESDYLIDKVVRMSRPMNYLSLMGSERDAFEAFRSQILEIFGMQARHSESIKRITFISRDNYDRRVAMLPVARRIGNERELHLALQKHYPDVRIDLVKMEEHPIEEQIDIVNNTDLLLGMHGAAMGYALLLPSNAAVLELFPFNFRRGGFPFYSFYAACATRQLHYRRWIQWRPWRDYASDEYRHAILKDETMSEYDEKKDCSFVAPAPIIRRVAALVRAVESTAKSTTKSN